MASIVGTFDQERFFADRLARQKAGRGQLLVALHDGRPIGDVYLRLEPAEEPDVRRHLRRVPLLEHHEVLPAWRRQGIGTKMMRIAEDLLRRLGHRRVALKVGLDNADAVRFYERLGYISWDHPPVKTVEKLDLPNNRAKRVPSMSQVFVKELAS